MIINTTDDNGNPVIINLNHVTHATPIKLSDGRTWTCFHLVGENCDENVIRTTAKFTDVCGYWSNYTI